MTRKLLLEHNAPLLTPPSAWKVELVQPQQFGESLIESYVSESEARFSAMMKGLLESETLTEEKFKQTLAGFKDSFVNELREAHQHKRMRVSGPAQLENARNGNGRMYPTALWDRVLGESSDFSQRLRDRHVLGELEHPAEGNTKLPRVSHLVERVWRQNGTIYAQHLIFRTPMGSIIEELYRGGAIPGVSSRGAGSTRQVDGMDVVEASDFHLDTWDFVAQPSVAVARPGRVGESSSGKTPVSEGANWAPHFVNTGIRESKSEEPMSQLIEHAELLSAANLALQEARKYMGNRRRTVQGLLQQQEALINAMGTLNGLSEGYTVKAADLRARCSENVDAIRREASRLQRIAEGDDNDQNQNGNGAPTNQTDDNGDTANSGDGGGNSGGNGNGNDNGGNDNPFPPKKKDQDEALVFGVPRSALNRVHVADVLEELARRNIALRGTNEGQVPSEKYRLAIQLGEELVARSNNDRRVYESRIKELSGKLTEANKAGATTRTLLEATVRRYRAEKVTAVVESLIERNPQLKRVEKKLRECKSVGEVKSLIENVIQPLAEGSDSRPDLPRRKSLKENSSGIGSPASRRAPGGGNLMSLLAESEAGGHLRS